MSTGSGQETGQVTGTTDKDYDVIWFTEVCLSNVLRLETYIADADRDGDTELADFFRKAQAESPQGRRTGQADAQVPAQRLTQLADPHRHGQGLEHAAPRRNWPTTVRAEHDLTAPVLDILAMGQGGHRPEGVLLTDPYRHIPSGRSAELRGATGREDCCPTVAR
jgi:hypothetical protein